MRTLLLAPPIDRVIYEEPQEAALIGISRSRMLAPWPVCRRTPKVLPALMVVKGRVTALLGTAHVLAHRLAIEAQGVGHLGDVVSRLPMRCQRPVRVNVTSRRPRQPMTARDPGATLEHMDFPFSRQPSAWLSPSARGTCSASAVTVQLLYNLYGLGGRE